VTPEVAARYGAPPADAFTIAPALVQPTSTGSVRLASNNFQDAAVVDCNYLGTDRDLAAIVRAIEAARELGISGHSTVCAQSNWFPAPSDGDDIREFARLASGAINIRWAPARWASTTSLLWIPRCESTDFRACEWPMPR